MTSPAIKESSGLVVSRRFEDLLWTHNDSKHEPEVFAIGEKGELIRRYRIPEALNMDWEDLAWDSFGNLYIFDNASLRDSEQRNFLYILAEPDPFHDEQVKSSRKLVIRYPDGAQDCEAIFIWDGTLYMVTKPWKGTKPRIYRYDDLSRDGTAEFVGHLPVNALITGAAISDDGRRIALSSYRAIFLFEGPGSIVEILQSQPTSCRLNAGQVEGISWDANDLFITNEEGFLFEISNSQLRRQLAPFLETPKLKVPYISQPPSPGHRPEEWRKGTWLKVASSRQSNPLGRVVWSREGLHVGITLPADLRLAELPEEVPEPKDPRDYDSWFVPGSLYLLLNPDGSQPITYGAGDRCLSIGSVSGSGVAVRSLTLLPATYVINSDSPEGIAVTREGNFVLVTLPSSVLGYQLEKKKKIGFNLILVGESRELYSWAPLTLPYSWDNPAVWGSLELGN